MADVKVAIRLWREAGRNAALVPARLQVLSDNRPDEVGRSSGIAIDVADRRVWGISIHVWQTTIIRVGSGFSGFYRVEGLAQSAGVSSPRARRSVREISANSARETRRHRRASTEPIRTYSRRSSALTPIRIPVH